MYVRTYVRMYVCMYVCEYVCMYVRMYACMHAHRCMCTYACVCIYVYVCTYARMNVIPSQRIEGPGSIDRKCSKVLAEVGSTVERSTQAMGWVMNEQGLD